MLSVVAVLVSVGARGKEEEEEEEEEEDGGRRQCVLGTGSSSSSCCIQGVQPGVKYGTDTVRTITDRTHTSGWIGGGFLSSSLLFCF